jgi:hypothetical protein
MRKTSIVVVACALVAAWGTGCGDSGSGADMGPDGHVGVDMGTLDTGVVDTGVDSGDVDLGVDLGDVDMGVDLGDVDMGPSMCGNGTLDTGETCDTAIDPSMPDGCPITCNDGDPCTMDVTMGSACTTVCTHTALTASGTTADTCCPAGADATTDVDCGTPPSGFRVTAARLISPRVVQNILGCSDLTDTGIGGGLVPSLNSALMGQITGSTGGTYDLSIVSVFRPLVPAATATTPMDVVMNASCTTATPPVCTLPAMGGAAVSTTANNMMSGTCFAPTASEVNGSCSGSGSCAATYTPTADTASGPCFESDETDIVLAFTVAGTTLRITLHHARVAATYSGSPVDTLMPGVVTGFLTEQEAADIIVDIPSPLGGTITRRLYELLQAGGDMVTASDGTVVTSSCNVGGGGVEDDRDMVGTERGFKFFLNVTLDTATWMDP